MPRRARIALPAAAAGVVLLAATWYLAHYVGFVRHADVSILMGFAQLDRPGLDRYTNFVAHLCDPHIYVLLAAVPVIVALARRRPQVAVMLALVLITANETTQLLKPAVAAPRDPVPWGLGTASWPSGHATAAMSLALCIVIAAPARRRPVVAAVMAAFAIAVSYSFLELGWHYPSDVFGGFLVAGTWTLLGIAGVSIYDARRARGGAEVPRQRVTVSVGEVLMPVALLLGAAVVCFALILVARPHPVIAYARAHEAFVVGASAIGVVSLGLASGLALFLRRG